jgi:hypothetical protein
MTDTQPVESGTDRALARKRIEKRRGLQGTLVAYIVVNAFFIAVWALTGGGYFWPAWILGAWGMGLVLGFWDYRRGPVTDRDVDEEIRRMMRQP